MAFETGRTFSASVRNARSGATGLIQFMPTTAIGLGTTVDALAKLTPEEQLPWVERYFRQYSRARYGTLASVYMAILYPVAINEPDDFALFKAGTNAYAQNHELDLDDDHVVTKAEAAGFVQKQLTAGLLPENLADVGVPTQPAAPIEDRGRPYNPEQDAPSQEAPMPGIAETIAAAAPAVGTIFGGPVGGLLGSLAGAIISGFAPLAQEKISRELARHTNSPETAAAVSTALTTGIVDMAKQLTGKADPVEAVVLAKNDPAMMQKMEAATLVKLGELEPFLNAINGYEQAAFERGESSAKAAASRLETIPELRALAVMLARHSSAMMLVILVALGVALAVQMYFSSTHTPDATLATLFGGALAVAYQNYGQVFNLVFGAPPESEASKAGAAELNARRPRS